MREQGLGDGEDRKPAPCCMTFIGFRNLTEQPLRVTGRGPLGDEAQGVIKPGKTKKLRRLDRSEKFMIPGGLGRCVTITVEVADERGRWHPLTSEQICCDTHKNGDEIIRRVPRPDRPGATHARDRKLLKIEEIRILKPCPPQSQVMHPGGRSGVGKTEVRGLYVPGKGHFLGADIRLVYIPRGKCRHFCFIQAVKRTVTLDGRKIGGVSFDWRPDLLPGQRRRPPCYKYVNKRRGGGAILRDSPGLVNPWGRMRIPGGGTLRPRPGQRLVVEWEFRSWPICLKPPAVYGQFDWGLRVELVVPARAPARGRSIPGAKADVTGPGFKARGHMTPDDEKLFKKIMGP